MKSLLNTLKQPWSVLQHWHRQGMTQEYILYFLVLDYSHSCLVLSNSLAAGRVSRGHGRSLFSVFHAQMLSSFQPPPSRAICLQTSTDKQHEKGLTPTGEGHTPDPEHCQVLSLYNGCMTIGTALPHFNVMGVMKSHDTGAKCLIITGLIKADSLEAIYRE